jgi:hypothetical protein
MTYSDVLCDSNPSLSQTHSYQPVTTQKDLRNTIKDKLARKHSETMLKDTDDAVVLESADQGLSSMSSNSTVPQKMKRTAFCFETLFWNLNRHILEQRDLVALSSIPKN